MFAAFHNEAEFRKALSYRFHRDGGEGGILTPARKASYHVFSNLHETRMNTGDFYDLSLFNSFNRFA